MSKNPEETEITLSPEDKTATDADTKIVYDIEEKKKILEEREKEIERKEKEIEKEKKKELKQQKAAEKKAQKEAAKQKKTDEEKLKIELAQQETDTKQAKKKYKIKLPEFFVNPSKNDNDRKLQRELASSWLRGLGGEKETYSAQIMYLGPRRKASRSVWKGIPGRPAQKGRWYMERTPIFFFRNQKLPHLIKDPDFILEALTNDTMWQVEFIKDHHKKEESIPQKLIENRTKHLKKNFQQRRDLILLSKVKAPLKAGEPEKVLNFAQENKIPISEEILNYLQEKQKECNK